MSYKLVLNAGPDLTD